MEQGSREPEALAGAEDLVPGRYRLKQPLGRGGMGEVCLADDLLLRRQVAIKLVAAEHLAEPAARHRLLKEAQIAAALDHPNICQVYDSGEAADGRAFFVMQYVEGETLARLLERRALSPAEALTICKEIADALSAAHRHGLVHRDVKPSNIIITPSGTPKLLDLGIAKIVSNPVDAPTITDATSEGMLVGTPAYMSPEQVHQRPIDGRSDLFSLGALLYETLTGCRAFTGAGAVETMASVLAVEPPPPSSVRPELTTRHDDLCRKLLAKRPGDRYQSADQVVTAIEELADESRASTLPDRQDSRGRRRIRPAWLLAAGLVLAGSLGLWMWIGRDSLPRVPEEADGWYRRGTNAIREGAYVSGRTALEKAIALFEPHVLAYARLAEADAELDDNRSAQKRLLQAQAFGAERALPFDERLRLTAVRALVLRDVDAAVAAYGELVKRRPMDAPAWLDLGRAQESAGLRSDATRSYEKAVQLDSQYAAAFLRLASMHGLESRYDAAIEAFATAERLYQTASEGEGEVEVLIRRGSMRAVIGRLKEARADLERALDVSGDFKRTHQQLRAQLALSSITASEGQFAEAKRIAEQALQTAIDNNLDTMAAEGLIDLAALVQTERSGEAMELLRRARQLAENRGAARTAARARLQEAALHEAQGRARNALDLANELLPFWKTNRYRRYELVALTIAARAHLALDQVEDARRLAHEVLEVARTVKDESQEAQAANSLAAVTTVLGGYPDALRLRERALAIHRQQGDHEVLPFDLASVADMLTRIGRAADAEVFLVELETGIAKGLETYVGRARRVAYLRTLAAATLLRCDDALRHGGTVRTYGESRESAAVLTPGIEAFCQSRLARRQPRRVIPPGTDAPIARELHYWYGLADLRSNRPAEALTAARSGLESLGTLPNDEVRWRLAALAASAARQLRDEGLAEEMRRQARKSFDALKSTWNDAFASYERRLDLVDLRNRAGMV